MWSNRDVRRVVLARFVSRVGGEAAFFVGIWGKAAFDLDATPTQLALVMVALGVASLIGSALAGVLVDRFDPKRVLIAGEIVFVPIAVGMMFADTIPSLAAATFLLGLAGAPVFTAISSFGPFLTDDEGKLARINGFLEGASWAAFVVGPAVGAILAGTFTVDSIFLLDAITSAIAALMVVGVSIRQLSAEKARGQGVRELREGFQFAYNHRRIRFYIWIGSTVWLTFGTFSALEPLFFRDILGVEVETMGWVASIFGIGLVTGTLLAGRLPEQYRTARALTTIVALNAIGVIGYVGTDRLTVVITFAIIWGVIIGIMAPLHRTLIQVNTPGEMMGRIMGVNQIHSEVGHLIPLVFAPSLAGWFGVQESLLVMGVLIGVGALLFWPAARRLDLTREVEVPPTGLPDPSDEPRSVSH